MSEQNSTAPPAAADGGPSDGPLEKAWAVAGLIAAGLLAWMAIDLLRGTRTPPADAE